MEIVDDESAQESYCYCSRSAVHCMQLGLSVSVSSTEYKQNISLPTNPSLACKSTTPERCCRVRELCLVSADFGLQRQRHLAATVRCCDDTQNCNCMQYELNPTQHQSVCVSLSMPAHTSLSLSLSLSLCMCVCVWQRCDIINGDVQPSDSDCEWSTDESDTEVHVGHILIISLCWRGT